MMNKVILLLVALFTYGICFTVANQQSDNINPTLAFINRLFELKNLPISEQVPQCLSN